MGLEISTTPCVEIPTLRDFVLSSVERYGFVVHSRSEKTLFILEVGKPMSTIKILKGDPEVVRLESDLTRDGWLKFLRMLKEYSELLDLLGESRQLRIESVWDE